jgi:sarcosine oxidase
VTVYDAIVVGLGAAGASTAYHLAGGGASVLALEQFEPVHAHGSSHGRTRIYRTAYFEGAEYVPLLRRAQRLWQELADRTGETIVRPTGGLMIGRRDSPNVAGAQRTAEEARLPHELLAPADVQGRFPSFRLRDDEVALWDPNAGVLFPENCLRSFAAGATANGAELRYGEAVTRWSASDQGVEVRTRAGTYQGRRLVLAAGPWTASLAADLALPLEVERQFVLWFPADGTSPVGPDRMPVFVWNRGSEIQTYGVPDFGDGVKIGAWPGKVAASPETADRAFSDAVAEPVRQFVARNLSGLAPRESEHLSCLYTNAPDHRFVLGLHPNRSNVVVVSACSGHGFKFASVVGEVAAGLVNGAPPDFDLTRFDPGRFAARPGRGPPPPPEL